LCALGAILSDDISEARSPLGASLKDANRHDDGERMNLQGGVKRTIWVTAAMIAAMALGSAGAQAPLQPGVDPAAKASRTPVTQYSAGKHIYPSIESADADVAAAIAKAKREHKRVIMDFGADWCGDCQVLDLYFHQSPNVELMEKYFVEVKVNIGREDANIELAHKYGVPVHGVPALAVVDGNGKVIVSQDKEFSDMRYMQPQSVTAFLNKWKK
jgi:thiol:disulfide interchange protein